MAYLNVRERKMETRIAYVGPLGVGKTKNLEQLGLRAKPTARAATKTTRGEGDVLSLPWDPGTSYRDYPLAVEVVAPCDPERTADLVRDADAIVLVLDASPDASERNRAAVEVVRAALPSNQVPVVVQVNKADVDAAREPGLVVEELAIEWPHLSASASRGEGVVETLDRALADLVAHLDRDEPTEATPRDDAAKTPLLAALKDVLSNALDRRARSLEDDFAARIEERFAAAGEERTTANADLARLVASESERSLAAIAGLRARADQLEGASTDLAGRITSGAHHTTEKIAANTASIQALEQRLASLLAITEKLAAAHAAERAARDDLGTKIDRKAEELRAELVRAVETRARTDRELLISSIGGLKGSVDALAQDVRSGVSELTKLLGDVRGKVDAVGPVVGAVKDVNRALRDEVGAAIVNRVVKVEELTRHLGEAFRDATQRTEERDGELGERVKEISTAMKAKKSWFT